MNIEHPTSNVERRNGGNKVYDLEERLLAYSVRIIRLVEALPNTRAGNHVAGQLLRSGTAPLPNHGEAQAAESRADFMHKMKVCLKELRESLRGLRWVERVPLVKPPARIVPLLKETDELVRIFVKSLQTSQQRSLRRSKFDVQC
jgi:four helix bundle protein